MKSIIEFQNVSKSYRLGLTRTSLPALFSKTARRLLRGNLDKTTKKELLWALRDVSFDLNPGQSLALIGPNGAGKTTVLKLLAKITRPTSGHITVNGRLSALIELGSGFHPDLTGRENVYLNGTILGLNRSAIDQRFDEIVAFSELEQFIDTPIKRYSSGMAVRLGFSVAACIEPDILLVDEVLAVGDSTFRKKCVKRIKALLAGGTSIIFVSHNLWLVQAVCDLALFIDKGQIKYQGTTSEAIDAYDRDTHEHRAEALDMSESENARTHDVIEITNVEVIDLQSEKSIGLASNRPAEVRVRYTALKAIGAVNVVVRLIRSDGLTCCMMRSKVDDFPVLIGYGEGVVSIVLDPIQLSGGSFYAQAIIRDESDAQGMASRMSDSFYVSGSSLSHQEMNGVFELNRAWKHHNLDTTEYD